MGADKGAHTPASPCCCLCTEHPIPDAFWHLLPGLQRSHQLEGGTAAYLKARLCWYLACPSLHLLLSPSNLQLGAATSDNPRLLHIPKPSPLLPNASSSSLAVTQAALLPPGTAPSQGAGREVGVSPHPFLPGVTTSCHCSKSKQRPAHLFCDLLLSSYTPASPGPGPTAGRRWPLRPFQPRRHRGKPRVTSERWRGGPRRRAACRRRGPTGGFPRPPPSPAGPHRSPGAGGGERGSRRGGPYLCGQSPARPAAGRSMSAPCKADGEGGWLGAAPGGGGGGRSPHLLSGPLRLLLRRHRRAAASLAGGGRRGRGGHGGGAPLAVPAGWAAALSRPPQGAASPVAGRAAGRRGGRAARRHGPQPRQGGSARRPPAPGPRPRRNAAPLPRPARRRAGRAAVGGPQRRRGGRDGDGVGRGAVRCGAVGWGRGDG